MKRYVHVTNLIASGVLFASLGACAMAPAGGPSARSVGQLDRQDPANGVIQVVDVTDTVARRILTSRHQGLFSEELGEGQPIGSVIGRGDVLNVAIWEAPPAALFGIMGAESQLPSTAASPLSGGTTSRATSLPEQMVDSEGQITIPFVGSVQAAGRAPQDIAREISTRLEGKAHRPQVVVRLIRNAAATVTVVGDVVTSARVPLTAQGERILDVLASSGGVRQPIDKMTIQITRGMQVSALPLETIIRDPRQNVRLRPDDVMTVLFQPYSFTALGATGRNEEIPFEATGVTLAQALGRVAGLQDARADVRGVFLFRLEDPDALDPTLRAAARQTPDGKVPVIYRVNMSDPATFFIAQSFPIRDKDVLYVSNAPLADIQKFVNVIYSTVLPVATTATVLSDTN